MGGKTLATVNVETEKDKTGLYKACLVAWLSYLQSLGNAQYTAGWTNRMDTFFPPLPVGEIPATRSAEPNYQALAAALFRHIQKQ